MFSVSSQGLSEMSAPAAAALAAPRLGRQPLHQLAALRGAAHVAGGGGLAVAQRRKALAQAHYVQLLAPRQVVLRSGRVGPEAYGGDQDGSASRGCATVYRWT